MRTRYTIIILCWNNAVAKMYLTFTVLVLFGLVFCSFCAVRYFFFLVSCMRNLYIRTCSLIILSWKDYNRNLQTKYFFNAKPRKDPHPKRKRYINFKPPKYVLFKTYLGESLRYIY